MMQPDQSEVSVEKRGIVHRLADFFARFLDRIAPPFTEPEAIKDSIAWIENAHYVTPPRELADDDYIVLANKPGEPNGRDNEDQ